MAIDKPIEIPVDKVKILKTFTFFVAANLNCAPGGEGGGLGGRGFPILFCIFGGHCKTILITGWFR